MNKNNLRQYIYESVKKCIKEAVDGGWEVDNNEAQEAYEFAAQYFGEQELNSMIVECLGTEQLAECLAFIFRMNDFSEWEDYKAQQ